MKSAPPLEKHIVSAIVKALKSAGVLWILKTHGGSYQASGVPDLLFVAPRSGRLVAIEVKRPGLGRLTALQAAQIHKIEAAGGVAGVAFCADDALRLLDYAERGSR